MLSVVMVGRNDEYGYRNPARTERCLNGWAQTLDEGDEIIFVDWASPTKETLPERIRRDLLSRTQSMLRVLRVDKSTVPLIEAQWKRSAVLPVLEPHGRNLGIRQAKGPWVLSTNTDIVPQIVYPWARLLDPQAWYLSRPFLIDEKDWERHYSLEEIARKAQLNPARAYSDPRMAHSKVGDFQLAQKQSWEGIKGFEEEMSFLWGHSDSNVCIKFDEYLGCRPQVITAMMPIYHLNHASGGNNFSTYPHNDLKTWVTDFKESKNDDTWGMIPFEELVV